MKDHRRSAPGFRLRLEALEDRCVPADFSGEIKGIAFIDRNSNGRLDTSESVLKGAPVVLRGTTSQGTAVNVTASADAQGKYRFENVMPGTYRLVGGTAAGRTTAAAQQIVLTAGQTVNRNVAFGAVLVSAINLRQLLNKPTTGSTPTLPAGSGVAQAADRANNKPTIKGTLPDQTLLKNGTESFVDMAAFFDDKDMKNSQVRLKTSAGDINVELFDRDAPQTVANFFNYVTSDSYDNTIFHRLASGFVLQGGGYKYNEDLRTITDQPAGPSVKNEFDGVNRSNTLGTIAMAKLGNNPDSATNEFFFNLSDNSSNLDNQNGGFTVFGKIVGSADQSVINSLTAYVPSNKSSFNPAFDTIPLKTYSGTNFPTDATESNLALIKDVEIVKRPEVLTYSIVSNVNASGSGPSPVAAVFVNNQLKLTPVEGAVGTATLTVRATDKFGATVDRTFNVRVSSAPTTTGISNQNATVDSLFSLGLSDKFSDPENETLTYSAKQTNGNALPDWLTLSGGTLSGTPALANVGTLAIEVKATDPNGLFVTTTFTLTIANLLT